MNGVPAISAVLFDLDGTLLDTAPDMVASLNTVLAEQAREPLPYGRARAHVSHGVLGLLKLAFGDLTDDPRGRLQQRFLEIYSGRLAAETRIFDGMARVLDALEGAAIPWGVVTNKPAWLTEPLLGHMDLRARCACIVSGDTVARRKPDPLPLRHAIETLAVAAAGATYVGDAERDIVAGRAAGMRTVAALYGYIPAEEDASTWGADHAIRSPADLLEVLGLNQ